MFQQFADDKKNKSAFSLVGRSRKRVRSTSLRSATCMTSSGRWRRRASPPNRRWQTKRKKPLRVRTAHLLVMACYAMLRSTFPLTLRPACRLIAFSESSPATTTEIASPTRSVSPESPSPRSGAAMPAARAPHLSIQLNVVAHDVAPKVPFLQSSEAGLLFLSGVFPSPYRR